MIIEPSLTDVLATVAADPDASLNTAGFWLIGAFATGVFIHAVVHRNFGMATAVLVASGLHFGLLFADPPEPVAEPTGSTYIPVIDFPERAIPLEDKIPPAKDPSDEEQADPPPIPPSIPEVPQSVQNGDIVTEMAPPAPPALPTVGITQIPVHPRTVVGERLEVFNPDQLTRQPIATSQVAPVYPPEQKQLGISATVVVEFIVNKRGRVQNAFVIRSSHAAFESNALAAVARWRFEAGERGGARVNTRMRQLFTFNLSGSE
jgi:TonB family protein